MFSKSSNVLMPVLVAFILLMIISCSKDKPNNPTAPGTVTDIDGNVYQTDTIGTQVWMTENLKVTHYRNGDPIPNVTDYINWHALTTGAYCNYDNNVNHVATYGRLYNGYAVADSRNIAPEGWHVPSDSEWQVLIDYLGGDSIAGGKMKEVDTTHWQSPNTGATNESDFSALPGGYRTGYGPFSELGSDAFFWTSTESNINHAYSYWLNYNRSDVRSESDSHKLIGNSVRCVRD